MFIIPMLGQSSRFFDAGYQRPKFQLKISGMSLFSLSVLSFKNYFSSDKFVFVLRDDYDTKAFVINEIEKLGISNYTILTNPENTKGQAETIYYTLNQIHQQEELFIFNIDTYRPNYVKPTFLGQIDGYLEVFNGNGDHWSFVYPGSNQTVERTTEKERISNLCSDGLYYFKDPKIFRLSFENAVSSNSVVNGEFYIAPLYNFLIERNCKIKYEEISPSKVFFSGTPSEYEEMRSNKRLHKYLDDY